MNDEVIFRLTPAEAAVQGEALFRFMEMLADSAASPERDRKLAIAGLIAKKGIAVIQAQQEQEARRSDEY